MVLKANNCLSLSLTLGSTAPWLLASGKTGLSGPSLDMTSSPSFSELPPAGSGLGYTSQWHGVAFLLASYASSSREASAPSPEYCNPAHFFLETQRRERAYSRLMGEAGFKSRLRGVFQDNCSLSPVCASFISPNCLALLLHLGPGK